ncbi:MAG TPA: hypothetical protein PLW21_06585 [Methanothrix sp.]|nr:hypothetical protein [Methanothrix sp.]
MELDMPEAHSVSSMVILPVYNVLSAEEIKGFYPLQYTEINFGERNKESWQMAADRC